MKGFTFVALTYNQAGYILNHLESIRYQVETWGGSQAVHLIVSDDCSGDKTVPLAKAWLRDHAGLFASTQLLTAPKNQGIVQNYLRALRMVDTEQFKILAGDDLYYKNNVFAAAQAGAFVMSPVLYFQKEQALLGQYRLRHWVFQEFVHLEGKGLKKQLLKRQKVTNCIYTPGVFYLRSLIDAAAEAMLEEHTWMEDYPLWNHLLAREDVEPVVVCKPLILYRAGNGISARTGHARHTAYERERLAYLRKIGSPLAGYPVKLNPYRYVHYAKYFAKGMAYTLFVRQRDVRVDGFLQTMHQEELETGRYLEMLSKRCKEWSLTHQQNGGQSGNAERDKPTM